MTKKDNDSATEVESFRSRATSFEMKQMVGTGKSGHGSGRKQGLAKRKRIKMSALERWNPFRTTEWEPFRELREIENRMARIFGRTPLLTNGGEKEESID
jgi:hypothetical protein